MKTEYQIIRYVNFLVEDAFVFEKDGSVLGIPDEVIRDFAELCEHNGVAFRDHFVSEFDEYEMVKKENPDAIVMYKVGDFFEIYGERDTQIAHDVLELMLTRKTFTNKSISTPMCGFPVHVTEQYTQRLLDAGNDVVAVTHEPGEKLEVKRIVSTAKAIDTPPVPVGRIDYLGSNGEVGETVEYTDAERFERDIKDENYYGTPMSVVVYRNADGSTLPHAFISECDPPLQGFSIEDSPLIEHDVSLSDEELDRFPISTVEDGKVVTYKAAVAAAKAIAAAIKAIAAAVKELIAAIAAGGWVAVVVIVVICLVALIVGSCFGIFFSSEDKNDGSQSMREVVVEINQDYQNQLDTIKANNPYDDLEMSGSRAVWPEVLSVYAVKTTTDPDNPQEVATVTEEKKQLLTDIFWEMNDISYEWR